MSIFSFGHSKGDAVGAGFSSTPAFDAWSGAPGLFTSRPQIAFLEQALEATPGTGLSGEALSQSSQEILDAQSSLEVASRRSLANIDAKKKAIEARFSSPLDATSLFQIVDEAYMKVSQMHERGSELPDLFEQEKTKLRDSAVRLLELRSVAKILRDKPDSLPMIKMPLQPGSEWSSEFKKFVVVPYDVASAGLSKAVAAYGRRASNVAVLVDVPHKAISAVGDLVKTAVKQVPKALGLPTWFLPVVVGGVVVAAGASIVGSFRSFLPKGSPA